MFKMILQKIRSLHVFDILEVQHSRIFKQNVLNYHSNDVRQAFVKFFKKHDHDHLPSSSLAPQDDQSLLFTNAGMNQFKSKFLNTVDPKTKLFEMKRAVTWQKCVRVGGKHNDLEDVGLDMTHHTFFEMLGFWSFGDYYKDEACKMALKLLTEVYKIPQNRLYITYFAGDETTGMAPDTETKNIWKSLNISESKIIPCGKKDNFWEMGETGPCGPCTEIHYDFVGNRDASSLVNQDDPNVVELWNIVFIKYNRLSVNNIKELATYHIDTGMGLERLTSILQGKTSNYDTDLFLPVIKEIQSICCCPHYEGSKNNEIDIAYRIISDHMRMLVMSISDSIYPGPHGAPLLVRQVLQRGIYAAEKLCAPKNLLPRLIPNVIHCLKDGYPILNEQEKYITKVISEACATHYKLLERCHQAITRTLAQHEECRIDFPVQVAVTLCNRFRLPRDLFTRALKSYSVLFDTDEFERNTEALKELGRQALQNIALPIKSVQISPHFVNDLTEKNIPQTDDCTKFNIFSMNSKDGNLVAVIDNEEILINKSQIKVVPGKMYGIILNETNMFATCGGQISDTGYLRLKNNHVFTVTNVTSMSGYIVHHGTFDSAFTVGFNEKFTTEVNLARREACMRAHTAAHLVLKRNVEQDGQRVKEDIIVYGFTSKFSPQEIFEIEKIVHQIIKDNYKVYTSPIEYNKVKLYPNVRKLNMPYPATCNVVSIGSKDLENSNEYSSELCSGTSQSRGSNLTRITCWTGFMATKARNDTEALQKKVDKFITDCTRYHLDKNLDMEQLREAEKMGKELTKQAHRIPTVMKMTLVDALQPVRSKLNKTIRKLLQQTKAS